MLSNLFATRRELTRLRRENIRLCGEAVSREKRIELLEAKLDALDALRFEREQLLLDRVLTSHGKYAVSDEATHKVYLKDAEAQRKDAGEALKGYLQGKHKELLEDAREAGRPDEEADRLYKQFESTYIEDFQATFN